LLISPRISNSPHTGIWEHTTDLPFQFSRLS